MLAKTSEADCARTPSKFFQHEFPHERSDLSHWRKRLGDKLELLLAESLRVAHVSGALRSKDLKRVTVDTTVQPKNISFPTDAKLLHAAIRASFPRAYNSKSLEYSSSKSLPGSFKRNKLYEERFFHPSANLMQSYAYEQHQSGKKNSAYPLL